MTFKQVRAARRMTQADLAGLLHVDQSYVSRIERGERVVRDVGFLLRIADVLDIPAEELGLSNDLMQAVGPRVASGDKRRAEAAPGRAQAVAVRASQAEWRRVRQYLNQHRAELARDAALLYPGSSRLGPTTLIAGPGPGSRRGR